MDPFPGLIIPHVSECIVVLPAQGCLSLLSTVSIEHGQTERRPWAPLTLRHTPSYLQFLFCHWFLMVSKLQLLQATMGLLV